MRRGIALFAFSFLAIAAVSCASEEGVGAVIDAAPTSSGLPLATSTTAATGPTATPQPPATAGMLGPGDSPAAPVGALDTSKSYTATIKTEKGDIVIELLDDIAPLFVENFVNLSRIGFYDDTTFHRVIPDFSRQQQLCVPSRARGPPLPSCASDAESRPS